MNQPNNNADKITIKVRLSDEDYHDITIDWSKEVFDIREQLFKPLSAYSGIPVKYLQCMDVHAITDLVSMFSNEYQTQVEASGRMRCYQDTKEHMMSVIQDGDCFLVAISMIDSYGGEAYIGLWHRDLVNEAGCNQSYCYYQDRSISDEEHELIELDLNIKHLTELECAFRQRQYPLHIHKYLRYRG